MLLNVQPVQVLLLIVILVLKLDNNYQVPVHVQKDNMKTMILVTIVHSNVELVLMLLMNVMIAHMILEDLLNIVHVKLDISNMD